VNEKQMFGALVRALGILISLEGFRTLWFTLAQWVFPNSALRAFPMSVMAPQLAYAVFDLGLGVIMIRRPIWLVRLAWLEKSPAPF
jgi:hypothetical protein